MSKKQSLVGDQTVVFADQPNIQKRRQRQRRIYKPAKKSIKMKKKKKRDKNPYKPFYAYSSNLIHTSSRQFSLIKNSFAVIYIFIPAINVSQFQYSPGGESSSGNDGCTSPF